MPERNEEPEPELPGEGWDAAGGSSGDPAGTPSGGGFVRHGLLFYGAMAIAAVLWRVGYHGEDILYAGGAQAPALDPFRNILIGLMLGGVVLLLSQLMTAYTRWGEELAQALARGLGPLSLPDALLLALASGMAEEMFFRGALQPRVGWVTASVLFGALHFVPRREFLPWTAFAVIAGLLFGAAFEYTGNLIAPVVAHALVNGVNLPLLVRRYAPEPGTRLEP